MQVTFTLFARQVIVATQTTRHTRVLVTYKHVKKARAAELKRLHPGAMVSRSLNIG